jgi:pseudouridine kinase
VVAALADMGLYEAAFERQLRRKEMREFVAGAGAHPDRREPARSGHRPARRGGRGIPVHAIAISPAKAGAAEAASPGWPGSS